VNHPSFGSWIRGIWAGENNPHRDGMLVRVVRRPHGGTNPGTYYQLTDGHGAFWEYEAKDTVRVSGNGGVEVAERQGRA